MTKQNRDSNFRRAVDDDFELRERHARAMRDLIDLAKRKQELLGPDDITVAQMIDIFKFAPSAERAALGMPETVSEQELSEKFVSEAHREFDRVAKNREKAAIAAAEMARIVEAAIKRKNDGSKKPH
jgi:hypothetical protein